MMFVKNRYCVSGSAYHEMAQACKQMPRHYKLKQKITELNSLWNITPTPNGIMRVQQSLEPILWKRIRKLEMITPLDAPFKLSQKVRVKISGKRIQVENFTSTLLDEEKSYSYEACHPFGYI